MSSQQQATATFMETLDERIEQQLARLGHGTGEMDSVVYDTAWIARISPYFPGNDFEQAVEWLRRTQRADGSWGGDILHYHDRVISTLIAIIALREAGGGFADEERIRHGETFIWREQGRLRHDAHDTNGFPILAVSLVKDAQLLDLDIPGDLYRDVVTIEKKLNLLGHNPNTWRYTTVSLSMEAIRTYLPEDLGTDFFEVDGSIASCVSATAGTMLHLGQASQQTIDYVRRAMADQPDVGGLPFLKPFDTFEAVWAFSYLWRENVASPDHPEIRRLLNFLWERWYPGKGISFSPYFHIPDLDDTAVAFMFLRWGGYDVSADVLADFEEKDYFRCYPGEADQSLSVNIRTLRALQMDKSHPQYENWSHKIIAMLRRYALDGNFWFDKWHVSPYYLANTAICNMQGLADDVLYSPVKWILKTQHADGGWGYYDNRATVEETAFCLQALMHWHRHVELINQASLHAAAHYIIQHYDDPYPPLWLGKSLYHPVNVVRSAVLAALYSYGQFLNENGR
jgi:halimadienyl-diphosphate synthase